MGVSSTGSEQSLQGTIIAPSGFLRRRAFRLDGCGSSYRRLHNVEGVLDTAPTLAKFLWQRRKHLQRLSDLFSAGHARDLDPPPKLSKTHTNDRATPRDLWSIFGFSFVDRS
jgi:hypothetical protein